MTSRPETGDDLLDAPAETADADQTDAGDAVVVDESLLTAHDLALAALREITPDSTVGEPAGYTVEEGGVVSLRFENRLAGYPGWFWTVSVARVAEAEPSVLEVELLPGDDALLAPEWVPWAVRLAEYQAQQRAAREAAGDADSDEEVESDDLDDDEADLGDVDGDELDTDELGTDEQDDDELDDVDDLDDDELDDVDDLDAAEFDADGSPILHAGDVDGVDIDELDDTADDELDDDEDDDDDDPEERDSGERAEEDVMSGTDLPGPDELSDEDFVSDEDDLGDDELQEGPAGADEAVEEGGVLPDES